MHPAEVVERKPKRISRFQVLPLLAGKHSSALSFAAFPCGLKDSAFQRATCKSSRQQVDQFSGLGPPPQYRLGNTGPFHFLVSKGNKFLPAMFLYTEKVLVGYDCRFNCLSCGIDPKGTKESMNFSHLGLRYMPQYLR